jgi:hypothetical protein
MSGIRWKSFAAVGGASLCATCVWAPSAKAIAAARCRLSAASSAPTAWFPFESAEGAWTPNFRQNVKTNRFGEYNPKYFS